MLRAAATLLSRSAVGIGILYFCFCVPEPDAGELERVVGGGKIMPPTTAVQEGGDWLARTSAVAEKSNT